MSSYQSIVVFVEEQSAKALLDGLVERFFQQQISSGVRYKCFSFGGKAQLKRQIPLKIKKWRMPKSYFIVSCDQDNDNCVELKNQLTKLANCPWPHAIIIVCQELENFYLGDMTALQTAFELPKTPNLPPQSLQNIDAIKNAKEKVKAMVGRQYGQIDGARRMAKTMNPQQNQSQSFRHLWGKLEAAFA